MSEIESPCVKICVIEPDSGYCIGCGRTGNEIASWIALDPAERRQVIDALPDRLSNLTKRKRRKGGARARRSA